MPDRSRIPAALIAACAALLPALLALRLPGALDDQDGVNFALALADYDPRLEQPHFPGYPLYIALCRLFAAAGASEPAALALPGVLASAALVPAMVALGRAAGLAERTLALAAVLLLAQPLVWLEGPRPAPDLLGASLAWTALALAALGRAAAGGAALGLALGARVDLAPLAALTAALDGPARRRFLAGIACGVAAWLPGFALVLPPDGLAAGIRFARGHFLVWGSSALSGAGGDGAARGLAFAFGGPLLALASAFGARAAPPALIGVLAAGLAPYALWVLLGQNLASPRHLLPLAPALALTAAHALVGLGSARGRALAGAALAASLAATGAFSAAPHPDGRVLAARVAELCRGCAAVFAGPEVRLLEHYGAGGALLYRRASVAEVRRDLAAWPELAGPIGLTSTLADSSDLPGAPIPLGAGVRLYRIDAEALR